MDDANAMIAAHCGAGGYAITREGESVVGDTVVTEAANSVDAQTTDGSGQVQAHDSSKTVFARGSDWQVHYSCNDPRTVNMGLITRTLRFSRAICDRATVAGASSSGVNATRAQATSGTNTRPRYMARDDSPYEAASRRAMVRA